jgi:tRNA/tmRNA/rRNA uracil-C5-methylase (TrmA/RlmC/RlmD family)
MREEIMAKLLEKIKKEDPNEAAKLANLREEDPKAFRMEFRKYMKEHGQRPEGFEPNQFRGSEGPMGQMGRENIREHIQARENELMTWLQKNDPNKAKELSALKEKDPPAYMRRMMFEMKNYRQIIEAEQTNPALAEVLKKDLALKQKRNDLLDQIKETTDEAKKKELTDQLKTVIGDRFDLIVQKKQLKYEELKKKLEELQQNVKKSQTELENIKSKKTEQVELHLKDLLNQSEKIDWD